MSRIRKTDSKPEVALRKALWAAGVRGWRLRAKLPGTPDVVFSRARLVVFVDGCFWHGCPQHATWPKQNAEFWRAKIVANQARDRDTDKRLRAEGWKVIRVWAHEEPGIAARRIAHILERRRERKNRA